MEKFAKMGPVCLSLSVRLSQSFNSIFLSQKNQLDQPDFSSSEQAQTYYGVLFSLFVPSFFVRKTNIGRYKEEATWYFF